MAEEPETEAELTDIPASEILDKIQKGEPVVYDHVRIIGDLDVNKLDLHKKHVDRTGDLKKIEGISEEGKVVSASIKITNSTFNSRVNFSNIFVEDPFKFENTTFIKDADFRGATFSSIANFMDAKFSGNTDFNGATFYGYTYFRGATFNGVADFSEATFCGNAYFGFGATFNGEASFGGATFYEYAGFSEATFNRGANFSGATFSGSTDFSEAIFYGHAGFSFGATFYGYAYFSRATFYEYAGFNEATFNGIARFSGATFNGNADFSRASFSGNADFSWATFSMDAYFTGAKFAGDVLTFRKAIFNKPESQEEACRRAKNVLAKAGNRDEEEYHFYREMEAKRIQKGIRGNSGLGLGHWLKTETYSFWKFFWYDFFEYIFIQKIFGYGVHPWWLMAWWGIIVALFAIAYWVGNGIGGAVNALDYIKISFATAIAPGYIAVIINPASTGYRLTPAYQAVAILETIIGTFLWAGFIATFAKRYMR